MNTSNVNSAAAPQYHGDDKLILGIVLAVVTFWLFAQTTLNVAPTITCVRSLVFLNVPAMAQPEAYLGHADKLFDAGGKLANDGTRKFLQDFMHAFDAWITANNKS